MNEQTTPLPVSKQSPSTVRKRSSKLYWIISSCLILCGIAYLIYWLIWGQYHVTTDDAYVNGNMIMVTPQESGIVISILVDNTQLVEAGQPLVELDPHDFEIALEGSQADLAQAVRDVVQMFIRVEELSAKREVKEADFVKAQLDYDHRYELVGDNSVSREDFEHSETALAAAIAALKEVDKELEGAIAEVENTTIATHPKVEQAKAALRKSYLALHRCKVLAPVRGIVTQRKVQVGEWVTGDESLMGLVPIDQMWVDANYREVSLKNLRIGQPVKLISDMYGSSVEFHGKIVGLNPGTGSVFSILPPQNATGNWIKIIQRVPVKISLNLDELSKHPLVLGLSMTTTTDTHNRKGLQLPAAMPAAPIYTSDVYQSELAGVEDMIDQIIIANISAYGT